jgi:hypothetical protein
MTVASRAPGVTPSVFSKSYLQLSGPVSIIDPWSFRFDWCMGLRGKSQCGPCICLFLGRDGRFKLCVLVSYENFSGNGPAD